MDWLALDVGDVPEFGGWDDKGFGITSVTNLISTSNAFQVILFLCLL